jgi:hypothetical protein
MNGAMSAIGPKRTSRLHRTCPLWGVKRTLFFPLIAYVASSGQADKQNPGARPVCDGARMGRNVHKGTSERSPRR